MRTTTYQIAKRRATETLAQELQRQLDAEQAARWERVHRQEYFIHPRYKRNPFGLKVVA